MLQPKSDHSSGEPDFPIHASETEARPGGASADRGRGSCALRNIFPLISSCFSLNDDFLSAALHGAVHAHVLHHSHPPQVLSLPRSHTSLFLYLTLAFAEKRTRWFTTTHLIRATSSSNTRYPPPPLPFAYSQIRFPFAGAVLPRQCLPQEWLPPLAFRSARGVKAHRPGPRGKGKERKAHLGGGGVLSGCVAKVWNQLTILRQTWPL